MHEVTQQAINTGDIGKQRAAISPGMSWLRTRPNACFEGCAVSEHTPPRFTTSTPSSRSYYATGMACAHRIFRRGTPFP